jgi:hypothetical protein
MKAPLDFYARVLSLPGLGDCLPLSESPEPSEDPDWRAGGSTALEWRKDRSRDQLEFWWEKRSRAAQVVYVNEDSFFVVRPRHLCLGIGLVPPKVLMISWGGIR